jgi:tripartite-type tricarboxylate transporter receptor subunit TctC
VISLRLILLSVALIPTLCNAQGYSSRPITLVVPYTPGTGIDIIARTVGSNISERLAAGRLEIGDGALIN